MGHFADHPTNRWGILKLTHAMHFVQAKTDKRFTLVETAANGRTRLFYNNNSHD
jgi:hypothetical protein